MSPRNGIPTTYRGTLFRSRLEARWAAFFDEMDWPWEYEPFDADGYIPDFALLGNRPLLVEVKPAATLDELPDTLRHTTRAVVRHWRHDIAAVGIGPALALIMRRHPRVGWFAPQHHPWPAPEADVRQAWTEATNRVRWVAADLPGLPLPGLCHCGQPVGPYGDHAVDHTRQGQAMAARPIMPPPDSYVPTPDQPRRRRRTLEELLTEVRNRADE